MKRFITLFLLAITVTWANPQDTNKTQGVFESLVKDAIYLITGDKNSSKGIVMPSTKISAPQPSATNQSKSVTDIDEEKKLLQRLGIYIDDNKIAIDANKTKNFLESFAKSIEKSINLGVTKASQKAPTPDDLGIKVENEKVEIDLNKTKNFMMRWMKAIEVFAKELNTSLVPLSQ